MAQTARANFGSFEEYILSLGRVTLDFGGGTTAAGALETDTFKVTGARANDLVVLSPVNIADTGIVFVDAAVTAADTITVTVLNTTAGGIAIAASEFGFVVYKGNK